MEENNFLKEFSVSIKASNLTSIANNYGKQGNFNQAIFHLKEAIKLKPDYVPAYCSLGVMYRDKGMFKEALKVLNNAPHKMKLFEKEANYTFHVYVAITATYVAMQDKEKTLEYAKKALEESKDPELQKDLEKARKDGIIQDFCFPDSVKWLKGITKELE